MESDFQTKIDAGFDKMVGKAVLEKVGTTGKGTYYILGRKGLIKGSKGSRVKTAVKEPTRDLQEQDR
jgi:hypothetical protein